MRTLGSLRPDKRRRIARETLEIYSPLAHRLGIHHIKPSWKSWVLKRCARTAIALLKKVVKAARGNRKEMIQDPLGN